MGHVVVGVDGSDASVAALRWAMSHAELHGLQVVAVCAYDVPWTIYIVPTFDEASYAQQAQEMLDRTVREAQATMPDVSVESRLVQNRPAKALILAAEGADLLVVGSHGYGALSDVHIGSVANAVVNHAPCPVVVHRHRRELKND